jgi:predicted MPP superfamily phosphohydrolase
MWFVLTLMGLMFAADVWWWYVADRAARRAKLGSVWRWTIAGTMFVAILGLFLLIVARLIRMDAMIMPEWAVKLTFIWHLIILPLVFIPSLIGRSVGALWGAIRSKPEADEQPLNNPTRRAFLAQAMIVVPPAVTLAMTGRAIMERDEFRVRRIDLPLKNLPPALDGMTIAHIADPHVGSFMSDAKFRSIIDRTNELDADLVLHAGDMINHNLKDLPDGIEMMRRFKGRYGRFGCQGNHDLIEDGKVFESQVRQADIGMLLDESATVRVRNGAKVQILSPRWGRRRDQPQSDDWVNASVDKVLAFRDPSAFTILLAHHPHSFDRAAETGVPLTLLGHTHGGQIRLFGDIGFGPLMYKYWSGVYRQNDSAAVVSNGIGNWFPLRVNVPCEIIHLTLRRA